MSTMFGKPKLSPGILSRCAVALALAACLLPPSEARAAAKDKKKKPTTGRIEVSTNPRGYSITIEVPAIALAADKAPPAVPADPKP
jgi:hypothetical protein